MNAYHNLAGWLRDVRAVLGDRTELADSYYWQLNDLLREALQLLEPEDDTDEDPTEGDESTDVELTHDNDVVAVRGQGHGRPPRSHDRDAHDGSARLVRRTPTVAESLPRGSQVEQQRNGVRSTVPVAATGSGCGVARVEPVRVQRNPDPLVPLESRSVPRGTQQATPANSTSRAGRARVKKGGKRGKTTTKRTRR